MSTKGDDHGILSIRFNSLCDCFALAMQTGIRIYNVDPLVKLAQIDSSQIGSVFLVEMLNRSNYVGFVSGGRTPKFAENAVILYDLVAKTPSIEYTVPLPVVAFRLTYTSVVVLTLSEIFVFSLTDSPVLLNKYPTADNPQGVCEVACSKDCSPFCVFPAQRVGAVHIMNLDECVQSKKTGTSFTPASISACKHAVAAVAMSADSRFLATSSIAGTIVRLWSLADRNLLAEYRRGTENANIRSLAFAPPLSGSCRILLLAASDTGTAHVFIHNEPAAKTANGSPRGGNRQRYSILSSAAKVVAATTSAGVSSAGGLSPLSRVPQPLDACSFGVGLQAAKATRLVSYTHAIALSPDGRIQRFAILPVDGVARADVVDSFIEPFDDV